VQNASMLDQPCPTQSERSESAVLGVSVLPSKPEVAYRFEWCSPRLQRARPWLKLSISATDAGLRTMALVTFVRPAVYVPTCTDNQFNLVIHSPRLAGAPSEIGGATWC
jgi:hypothetical protein